MQFLSRAGLVLALAMPLGALAEPTSSDVDALRREIQSMRADYEARLQALEQRVKAAEAAAAQPPAGASTGGTASAAAAPLAPPPPAAAAVASTAGGGGGANSFNPALSLILSGAYTRTSQDPANYAITGFPLPPNAEIGPGTRGFSLSESELGFSASIDPWLRGAANIALNPDNSVSVEEAFIQTTSLDNGFSLKAGRFFSGIGYLNSQHSHTWDFVDNPLAYQAMLGTQYGDDGLQLTWIAPIDHYIELGAEIGRGRTFPGSDSSSNGAGMTALTLHTGGDIGDSSNWRAGVSVLNAKANNQALVSTNAAGATVNDIFNGDTRVWVLDGVWKWAPNGNATRTNFKLQGEYLHSTRNGNLLYDVGNTDAFGDYRVAQSGWYVQGVYQFMPRWRVGLRTERLDPGTPSFGLASTALFSDYRPRKNSIMVDFSPSEFSRIRLQFAQDRAREGFTDNQITLQYQMSLGAHGAHNY
ncbi:Phosphate-selective porin O and P [Variovorax sp. HW608]|uniref:porin n=1 Tax=Variovorax sp. HW608 TaxID=1034889 RepID=UPI00081FC8B3|nr:porin [Variovorax sp. HW608]SCK48572.1 Phosphate-selective porin O and P [Variovorax sp. HW608]